MNAYPNAKSLDELFASDDPADEALLVWVLAEMRKHHGETES